MDNLTQAALLAVTKAFLNVHKRLAELESRQLPQPLSEEAGRKMEASEKELLAALNEVMSAIKTARE